MKTPSTANTELVIAGVIIAVLLLGAGYELYALSKASHELSVVQANAASLSTDLASTTQTLHDTSEALYSEQQKNTSLAAQIQDLSGTVRDLNKLTQTDPELLAKYSKVYFLSDNYVPAKLTPIPPQYVSNSDEESILKGAWPFFQKMINDAEDDNVNLTVVSGYRSFDKQKSLKSAYTITYGTGANSFSAEQGYSEHQLGTAIDFSTKETAGALDGFEKTTAYAWLTKNAYKYGFILSYPPNNGYYVFEPWHWRFVGIALATELHAEKKNFYDLDQRDIDGYLLSFFNN